MLSRRLFLGTTAGAAGLFGFFGRLRFRPQRRRPIFSVRPSQPSPFRDIDFTYGEDRRLFAFYGGEPMEPQADEGQWQVFRYFGNEPDGRHVAHIKCRLVSDDEALIDWVQFAKLDGATWRNYQLANFNPQDAKPNYEFDFDSFKPPGGWNALA